MKNFSLYCFSLLGFLLLLPSSATTQGTWESIEVPTTQNLHSVCFVDSLFGWAVGDSGTILHTPDGGNSWILQESPMGNDIMYVFFLNRNLGWASAFNFTVPPYGTILLKTTDGGSEWIPALYPEENIFITCIHYFDSLHGWMGGKPHALVETTDGGINWMQAAIDTSTLAFFPVLKLSFLNEETGYACGGMFDIAGVIWRTHNGGAMWYAIDPSQAPADEVHSLYIVDELNVMGSGGDPDFAFGAGMIRTSDGGINWAYEEIGLQGIAFDLDFRTPSQAWSPMGPLQKLIFSTDSGSTWTEIPTPDNLAVFDLTFPDSLHGFAVGNGGAILKYRPPVQPGIPPVINHSNDHITCQIYPNPTAGITNYELQITKEEHVVLEVYDLLGSKIAEVIRAVLPAGIHSFSLDAGLFPEGIYLYSLRIDGIVEETKKLVVYP